jgi:hypothetical protein
MTFSHTYKLSNNSNGRNGPVMSNILKNVKMIIFTRGWNFIIHVAC